MFYQEWDLSIERIAVYVFFSFDVLISECTDYEALLRSAFSVRQIAEDRCRAGAAKPFLLFNGTASVAAAEASRIGVSRPAKQSFVISAFPNRVWERDGLNLVLFCEKSRNQNMGDLPGRP